MLLLKLQKLRAGSFAGVLIVLGTLTVIATVGQGIRDVAILAFPIVFSSMETFRGGRNTLNIRNDIFKKTYIMETIFYF
jgi:hypothetical protein